MTRFTLPGTLSAIALAVALSGNPAHAQDATPTFPIERFKVEETGLYHIHGLILVEREGQKKMVIGNKGEKIKTIGTEARIDMERLFQNKVHLELWVKVKSGWADDERALRSLGYGDD